jgi:hypothetical protein
MPQYHAETIIKDASVKKAVSDIKTGPTGQCGRPLAYRSRRIAGRAVCLAAVCVGVASSSAMAEPIIVNPSFEKVNAQGVPSGWAAWNNAGKEIAKSCTTVERADAPSGKRVAQLAPTSPQITMFSQTLTMLVPGRWYEVSAAIRCEGVVGQGSRLGVEYWLGSAGHGSIDSELTTGTTDWRRVTLRFQAPATRYRLQLDVMQTGQKGLTWVDDLKIRQIPAPKMDVSQRKVLPGMFWGMFTCHAEPFMKYARDMKEAGVYWQRMGMGATSPEIQKLAGEVGMDFACCLDGMPQPLVADDPCYPVTCWPHYLNFVQPFIEKPAARVRLWEVFNEPNLVAAWTVEGYANLLSRAAKAIKATRTGVLVGTGGFGLPYTGYLQACLQHDTEKHIDVAMIHPYCVDEGLDTHLVAVSDACRAAGRPEIAVAINETGWPTWDPATTYPDLSQFVSEQTQARHIVKLHIQALAHRVSFVTYLGWNDFDKPASDQAHNMGLVRVDGSKKPSWIAYTFMTKTLGATPKVTHWEYQPNGTRIYRFDGDEPVIVVWNGLRDMPVAVDVGESKVFPCDMFGTKLTVTPVSGRVELTAGDEPIYLVPVKQ